MSMTKIYSPYNPPYRRGTPTKDRAQVNDNKDLIEIVNELQNKLAASGNSLDISLPQIVVVGCQSAGKSSVLENIVGREFLPRGSGVVTRRPTVVQLHPCDEEYAVFLHKPNEIFKDFQEVKNEISYETNREPGPVGFSSKPISLKIFSPKVLKLTLVDLPGLIRVTVDSQSENSIKEVRNMVLEYINQPNSLILAVSPANQDIATSDAIEIAQTVDPQRVRTIGVLTKLDLMDDGTDARDILENKKIPLKRGYVGVLNRSQRDIDEGKDIDYCLDKEKNFFKSMPCYKDIADRVGTPYLVKTLHEQLYEHIRQSLPAVRQELSQKLAIFRKQLKTFNEQYCRNSNEPFSIQFHMCKVLQDFIDKFYIEIFGCSEKVNINELSAGALINYTLHKNIQNHLKLPEVPDEKKLLMVIANLHGIRNSLSLPSLALETALNHLLNQYSEPLNNLVDTIAGILLSDVEKLNTSMDSYPTLKSEVLYLMRKSIDDAAFNTKECIEKHMQAEMYFVNTYHKDFSFPELTKIDNLFPMKLWGSGDEPVPVLECKCENSDLDDCKCERKQALETLATNVSAKENGKMLLKIIHKYLDIQQKHVGDVAIKYILFFMVKSVMDFLKTGLVPTVLDCTNIDSIFRECESDFNKIMDLESTCKCLENALIAVQTF